jgi:peptide/nickel transport system substrate-binding protein
VRESFLFYLLRFFLILGIFIFLGMQYWSSNLIEIDLRIMKLKTNQLAEEVNNLKKEVQTIQHTSYPSSRKEERAVLTQVRQHIDPLLPNLLEEDPFYSKTLPEMLGPSFEPHGILRQPLAVLGKPQNLHPFSNWAYVTDWYSRCVPTLARNKFGIFETLSPDLAIKIEERVNKDTGFSEYWVHLRDKVYWQPLSTTLFSPGFQLDSHFLKKHPVTAYDFKFYVDAVLNPYVQEAISLRTYLGDIESVEVIDPLTFIVRWKHEEIKQPDGSIVPKLKYKSKMTTGYLRPLPSFVFKYFSDGKKIVEDDSDPNTYRNNSVWAQNFSQHWAKNIIVSCGAWVFDGMTDKQIRFLRNREHYFPLDALVDKWQVEFRDNPDSFWQEFKVLQLDTYEPRANQLANLAAFVNTPQYQEQANQGKAINRLDFYGRSYQFLGWNQAKQFFESKKVRQALTMAIDRKRIIQQNLNGMGIEINGPFYRYSSAYDESIPFWPYDLQKARLYLEEEGWYDSNGDGIIDKQFGNKRVPFQFSITYYSKSPSVKAIVEYIATALKEVGIIAHLNGVDVADLSAAFDDKSFDAIFLGWSQGAPPEDPKQLWSSAGAKEKGSSNAIGFANAEADKIIEDLEYESDPQKRKQLYNRFDAIIHEEAPYTFLYTPLNILLYRDYVKGVFVPAQRQDLIPGANFGEPDMKTYWLNQSESF